MKDIKNIQIVIVTCEFRPFPGGIGTYAYELANAVHAAGIPVMVVAPEYRGFPSVDEPFIVDRILGHHSISPKAIIKLLVRLRQVPDSAIILAADIRTVMVLYAFKLFHGRRYRAMLHGSEASKFKTKSLLFQIAKRAYLEAEFLAYNSNATGEIFREAMGNPANDTVSYLGVDQTWFVSPEGSFTSAILADLPASVPVFCSIGRVEPRKGQLETIRALARAREAYGLKDAVYVVAGRVEDETYADALIATAENLGVKLLMPGRLSENDLKLLLNRSSAHLLFAQPLPGKVEGFGLVLLEAAAQKCPSIASRVGGIPEVLGDTGTLVSHDDNEAFARELAKYAHDPDFRERSGSSAYERAGHFTWSLCASATFPELSTRSR